MTKVIVKINQPDPPTEVIHKHKNFGMFINKYYQFHTPSGFRQLLRKDTKKLVLAIIVAVLLLLLLMGEL